jgi:hypothetical protein
MKTLTVECTPGYQPSGVSATFPPAPPVFAHTPAQMRKLLPAGNGNGVDVQIVITDVPDHRSALSSVRRT